MAIPYVGEIRMFAGNFAPRDWMFCEGQILQIIDQQNLFFVIGTTYGGDGQNTFALPDLRGRLPIHQGNGFTLAEQGGVETVTLTVNQIPAHTHPYLVSTSLGNAGPQNAVLSQSNAPKVYTSVPPAAVLSPNSISPAGGSQP